jgi:hypothetical protein
MESMAFPCQKGASPVLSENPYVQLYIKRVLRRVPFDEDHEYVAGEITRELNEAISDEHKKNPDLSIPKLIKRLDDPPVMARHYRKKYGFTTKSLMLFNQSMIYASVAALYMVTAFVVFRLYPQREYVAYAICALSAVWGAKIAFDYFFPIQHVIFTAFVPPFLFLFYPINNAYQASLRGVGSFWDLLFSQTHRVPFVLTAIYLFLFLSLLSFRYIRLFHPVWAKRRTNGLLTLFYGSIVCATGLLIFGVVSLGNIYTRESNQVLSTLMSEMSAYSFHPAAPTAPAESLRKAAQTTDRVTRTYIGILVPPHKQPNLSAEAAIHALSLYTQGPDALVAYYHTSYSPKANRPLPADKLEKLVTDLEKVFRDALQTKGSGLPALVELQKQLDIEMTEFRTGVRKIYENWIYEGTIFEENPEETTP